MYEAITGTAPFNHSNPIKLILMQISERPPSFMEANPEASFSREQERIVMKALEKDPSRRYQTAEELGRDLWELTVKGSSGMVFTFGGDVRKSSAANSEANPLAGAAEIVDVLKSAGKPKKLLTFRFRKFRTAFDKDLILQAMDLSQRLLKKGADLSVFLDYEAAHLAHRSNLMSPEFHTDLATTEKIQSIQSSIQKLIKAGANVTVTEHWLRYFGIPVGADAMLPGLRVLDEDLLAEYLLERATSVLDYT